MEILLLVLIGIIIVGVVYLFYIYNRLVTLRMRVKESWSDIDVQLKRRNSLIPNLVNTVKGYMTHEKDLLEEITKLRSQVQEAENPKELATLNTQLSSALGRLQVAVENYPELKASTNFIQLQEELTNTEDKIAYSRRFYNQNVMQFNTTIQTFPNVFISGPLGFKPEEFFEASEEEKAEVKVDFSEQSSKKTSK